MLTDCSIITHRSRRTVISTTEKSSQKRAIEAQAGSGRKKARRTFDLDLDFFEITVTKFFSEDKQIEKHQLSELVAILKKELIKRKDRYKSTAEEESGTSVEISSDESSLGSSVDSDDLQCLNENLEYLNQLTTDLTMDVFESPFIQRDPKLGSAVILTMKNEDLQLGIVRQLAKLDDEIFNIEKIFK